VDCELLMLARLEIDILSIEPDEFTSPEAGIT
jgi:hypothetical protein